MGYYTGGDYFMAGDYYRAGGFFSKLKKGFKGVANLATHTALGKLATSALLGPAGASLLGAVAGGKSLPQPGTSHHVGRRLAAVRRPTRYRRRRRY
jgi:hypothetical protein